MAKNDETKGHVLWCIFLSAIPFVLCWIYCTFDILYVCIVSTLWNDDNGWFQVQNFMAWYCKRIDSNGTVMPFIGKQFDTVHIWIECILVCVYVGCKNARPADGYNMNNEESEREREMLWYFAWLLLLLHVAVNGLYMHRQWYFYRFVMPYASFWLISLWWIVVFFVRSFS